MTSARLLIDGPAGGAWNMAVDEVLLEAAQRGVTTLRFYQWSPATLSLGYFQTLAERETHAPSRALPIVRRSTGGGAIVHDRELTYSFALPGHGRFSAAAIYDSFHDTLIELLSEMGIAARRASAECQRDAEFLCFARRSRGDVLCGEYKIAGSAQRRQGRALLQHGSVLLARSAVAPELAGMAEIAGRELQYSDFSAKILEVWPKWLGLKLGVTWTSATLEMAEVEHCEELAAGKYSPAGWLSRR